MLDADTSQIPRRSTTVWGWVLLCSQTALYALLALAVFELSHRHSAIEGPNRPLQVILALLLSLTVFLFFTCPFLFRRVGVLAVTAWIGSLIALVAMLLPAT